MPDDISSKIATIAVAVASQWSSSGNRTPDHYIRDQDGSTSGTTRQPRPMEQGICNSIGGTRSRPRAQQGRRMGERPANPPRAISAVSWDQVRLIAFVLLLTVVAHVAFLIFF